MSRRLAALNFVLRVAVKPRLARTRGPEQEAREFERSAALFLRRPPYLRRLERPRGLHWISAGPCRVRKVILYLHGGGFVGYREVEKIAVIHGIHLRTGGFCNPGATQAYLQLSHAQIKQLSGQNREVREGKRQLEFKVRDLEAKLGELDEGFVGTIEAYMKKANDDGLEGLVEIGLIAEAPVRDAAHHR